MKKQNILFAVLLLSGLGRRARRQQEVYITLKEGVPAISLALPNFLSRRARSAGAQEAAARAPSDVSDDLNFSRIFSLLPKKYYDYIRPLDPNNIFFKDWESIQANILFVGEISSGRDEVIFEGKLFDVKGGALHLRQSATRSSGKVLRLAAHRMADEIVKVLSGEKPIFTTKIVFVSDRDGNDELYMMDYDGQNQTRLTFNKIRDYMPAWSPDGKRIAYTSYKNLNAGPLYPGP